MVTNIEKAWLDTIAWCEGTDHALGYQTMFTGKIFQGFRDHPRQIQRSQRWSSDAAGRYQFLSTTWDECQRALSLPDFSPPNQDRAALYLIEQRGIELLDQANFEDVLSKISWVWASIPGPGGENRYGQPNKTVAQIRNKLSENVCN